MFSGHCLLSDYLVLLLTDMFFITSPRWFAQRRFLGDRPGPLAWGRTMCPACRGRTPCLGAKDAPRYQGLIATVGHVCFEFREDPLPVVPSVAVHAYLKTEGCSHRLHINTATVAVILWKWPRATFCT